MVKIQIVVIFTNIEKLLDKIQQEMKQIVSDEYSKIFGCKKESIRTHLYNGKIDGKKSDIHLFIDSDEAHYNEGILRKEMEKNIAIRLRSLFPSAAGFNGIVTASDGEGKVITPANESNESNTGDRKTTFLNDPAEVKNRAMMYEAVEPRYSFDMLQLPQDTIQQIERALGRIQYERKVFEEWGLYAVMPSPVSALGFFGPPGTGKTLAAEAIASKLGKKIIRVSYAEIENKYVGEGPKNVKAVFYAAEKQGAVLFIDEADSLLSKRLTNVSDGTGQAFNSMRSQLLMSLENFHGIAIFATNLVVNYDKAFLSRLINIEFTNPDKELRRQIWETHLLPKYMNGHQLLIPLSEDVDIAKLAEDYELCGRDIRNAVIDGCVEACLRNKEKVDQECLSFGAQSRVKSNTALEKAEDYTEAANRNPTGEVLAKTMEKHIKSGKHEAVNIEELSYGKENSYGYVKKPAK